MRPSTVAGSVCYTAGTWERVMKIYAQGRLRLCDLICTKLPLSEWRDLSVQKQALKVLIYPAA